MLIWAVIAGLQKPNLLLVTAIGLVTIGIVLAAGGGDASGEVEGVAFAWDGFLYVLAAANAGISSRSVAPRLTRWGRWNAMGCMSEDASESRLLNEASAAYDRDCDLLFSSVAYQFLVI